MNLLTETKLLELKEALSSDPRILSLEMLEKKMEAEEEVVLLAKKKEEAEASYNAVLRVYSSESSEAKEAQKRLFKAKLALDEHPLVAEYNKAFVVVKDLYLQMDDVLFSSFRRPHICGDKHA